MKFSKSFPMGKNPAADKFIERIITKGSLKRIEPEGFLFSNEGKVLYLGSQGFMTIDKYAKDGKWEVTLER